MSLIPASLKLVVSNIDTKVLDQQINSSGSRWLNEGVHDVVVAGIDVTKINESRIIVRYADKLGAEHRDQLDIVVKNHKTGEMELGWRFRNALGALIPSIEAYDAFFAEINADNIAVFGMLTDMHARVTVARSQGNKYGPAEVVAEGGYVVRDTKTREVAGGPAHSIDEATAQAEARGFKKAFLNVTAVEATHGSENLALFENRMREFHTPKAPVAMPKVGNIYRPRAAA